MEAFGTVSAVLSNKGFTVCSISPEATVYEAIEIMAGKNVGSLLVMENDGLIGVVSERDYTRKIALKGKSSKQTPVREIMLTPVISATPAHTIADAMRIMTEHRIRHLPVLDNGKVVGVVSIGDCVNWIINTQTATINQMESYIRGEY